MYTVGYTESLKKLNTFLYACTKRACSNQCQLPL